MKSPGELEGFFISSVAENQFFRLLQTLQEPDNLGARFEFRYPLSDEVIEEYKSLGWDLPSKDLWVEWSGEPIRRFGDADLTRLAARLQELGYKLPPTEGLWRWLWLTLGHNGWGRYAPQQRF